MTRARTRTSKRKPDVSSQESLPEDCKENSPLILSQASRIAKNGHVKEKAQVKNKAPLGASAVNKENIFSPVRKSVTSSKVLGKNMNSKFLTPKTILCDRTNSPSLRQKTISTKKNELGNQENVNNRVNQLPISTQIQTVPKSNSHVPVYKTVSPLVTPKRKNLPPEKKEDMYVFEVDENEEPVPKRKRKKRAYVRKPKVGPKALTINNIKYSSTESLASLPEKPVKQKKNKNLEKCSLKPYASTTTLDNHEDTIVTVESFMSHPSSILLCENNREKSRIKLSVLRETISEECQSPAQDNPSPAMTHTTSISKPNPVNVSHHSHFSSNPRCYSSKFSRTPNPNSEILENSYLGANITFPHQVSSCLANSSRAPVDFLSSTPCKRPSLVVKNNSVFDESCDTNTSCNMRSVNIDRDISIVTNSTDKCFGFDEPEEVEEPLVSPIKTVIDLVEPVRKRVFPLQLCVDEPQPKPSAQEVIEMLKATLPKTDKACRESTESFDFSSEETSTQFSPTTGEEKETSVFSKPARWSYERQRKVRWDGEHEESDQEEVDKEKKEEKEPPKPAKKCYKKVNKANTTKPAKAKKPTKAKQKLAKEEEELERFAAQMNAQFLEIAKVRLVVE